MILSIAHFAEALFNPDGRFRTLGKFIPVRNEEGKLVFRLRNRFFVDFDILLDGALYRLSCPLRYDAETALGMERMCREASRCRSVYFDAPLYLEDEAIVYDDTDRTHRVSVVLHKSAEGVKLDERLKELSLNHDTGKLRRLLADFVEMALWIRSVGHGIKQHNVAVAPDDTLHLNGIGGEDRSPEIALALFLTAVHPACYTAVARALLLRQLPARRIAEELCRKARAAGFDEPDTLLHGTDREEVDRALERLSAVASEDRAMLVAEELLRLRPSEEHPSEHPQQALSERSSDYLSVGEAADGLARVLDTDGWHFVDSANRPAFDGCFLHAMPFHEGRAEVETESGRGLIDRDGRFVLPPIYEDLCWDDYNNRIYVHEQGCWSMLYRDGSPVSDDTYDWMGECSDDLVLVMKDGKHGYVTLEGELAIPLVYDEASSFSNGTAEVTVGGEEFRIDRAGKRL